MKKVISVCPILQDFVKTSDVSTEAYIGFMRGPSGSRGYVTQEGYKFGQFVCRSFDHVTYGNGWPEINYSILRVLLEDLLSKGFEVFVFQTAKELMRWLLDDADLA